MKNKVLEFQRKTVSALLIGLMSSLGQAANFEPQDQDLWAPLEEDKKYGTPFETQEMPFFELETDSEQEEANATYQKVLNLLKQKKMEQAEVLANDLVKQMPNKPEFYNLLAFVNIQKDNKKAASANYQQALKIEPDNFTALKGEALLAIENADFARAEDLIDKAILKNPKDVITYLLKANIAVRQKKIAKAENILMTALDKISGDVNSVIQISNNLTKLYLDEKQPTKILNLAQSLIDRYPNDNRLLSGLARAQIINQQYVDAEKTLQKIISQDQNDASNRLLLAQLLIKEFKNVDEAKKLIDAALTAQPENLDAIKFQIIALINEKKFTEALNYAGRADRIHPELPVGKMLKADVFLAQRQFDKALEYNQQAYKIKPTTRLLNQITALLSLEGKTEEAIQLLNDELVKTPKNLDAHFQIANLYLGKKDYSRAEEHYQVIIKEKPESPIVLNNLAMLYHYQDNPKALETARTAYDLAPDSAAIADTYGFILLKQGKQQEALGVLQKAVKLAPADPDIKFHLANAQRANGDNQAAIEILQEITQSQKAFENQKAAIDLLKQLKNK